MNANEAFEQAKRAAQTMKDEAIARRADVEAAVDAVAELEQGRASMIAKWSYEIDEAKRKGVPIEGDANPYTRYNNEHARLSVAVDAAKRKARDAVQAKADALLFEVGRAYRLNPADVPQGLETLLRLAETPRDVAELTEMYDTNATALRAIRAWVREHHGADAAWVGVMPADRRDATETAARRWADRCEMVAVGQLSDAALEELPAELAG